MSGSFKKTRPNEMRLIPLKPKSNYKSEIVHNFERVNQKTHEREADVPLLNFDSPAWMPGILGSHERHLAETNPDCFKESFFAKGNKDDEEELEQLMLPRPPRRATFCGTCEQSYEDYFRHVNSEEHQTKFRAHPTLETILYETAIIQEEFQNCLLNEINFDEISSKETFAPDNNSKSDSIFEAADSQKEKEIRYNKSANKENDDPASNQKKERTIRRLHPLFYEDYKEQPEAGRQNPGMGRKIQVKKVFDLPTASQTEKMVGENYNPVLKEENKNNSLRKWMFSPQDSMKNSQIALLGVSTDVEQRESVGERSSRNLKRKYATFTESDQEVLNSFKKVKITDDNSIQEDQKVVQIPVNIVRGTFNYLMNAFSESLGNLKVRLFNQFGKK